LDPADQIVDALERSHRIPPGMRPHDGAYVLNFEGKYRIELRSVGRDRVLLKSELPGLPAGRDRPEALRQLMRVNLSLASRTRCSLAVDTSADKPFLYDMLTPSGQPDDFRGVIGFVNEVAAFHTVLEHGR
jgi:hypothetical protein